MSNVKNRWQFNYLLTVSYVGKCWKDIVKPINKMWVSLFHNFIHRKTTDINKNDTYLYTVSCKTGIDTKDIQPGMGDLAIMIVRSWLKTQQSQKILIIFPDLVVSFPQLFNFSTGVQYCSVVPAAKSITNYRQAHVREFSCQDHG